MSHSRRSAKVSGILIVILVFIGLSLVLYPTASNLLAQQNALAATYDYRMHVASYEPSELASLRQAAAQYNQSLRGSPVHDPFVRGGGMALPTNYTDMLNIGDGLMGYLTIPSINVDLPIYHGTSAEVLAKGVGHMQETALPMGEVGARSVLTSHTGFPSAELFNNLTKLKIGDLFYVTVLDEVLSYRVTSTEVILPTDVGSIQANPGVDEVTLLTCTPYGINSHRLLVNGERCDVPALAPPASPISIWLLVLGGVAWCLLFLVPILIILLRKPREKDRDHEQA